MRVAVAAGLALAMPWPGLADEPSPAAAVAPRSLAETGPRAGAVEPVTAAELAAAIDRGVAYLLDAQRADGSWGSADNTKGGVDIYAPPPGGHHAFRAGVTALCVSAVVESGRDDAAARAAIDRGEAWLLERLPKLRRATPDALYNVWGHAYGIEALALLHGRHAGDAAAQARI
ncbi:MAG: hypothetical protein ACKOC4_00995, partial [Planctomycetia bacterium]